MCKIKALGFSKLNYTEVSNLNNHSGNRVLDSNHVKQLRTQMETSFDAIPPITVNKDTNTIIDGQHRAAAFVQLVESNLLPKDAMLDVKFVSIDEAEEKVAIIEANTHSKNWSLDSYIASYVREGNKNFLTLESFCLNHSLTCDGRKAKYRYGAAIIKGVGCSNVLKHGLFECTEDEIAAADEIHAEMVEIADIMEKKGKGSWIEALACSWIDNRQAEFTYKQWKSGIKAKKNQLMKMPSDNQHDWDAIFALVNVYMTKLRKKGELA